MLTHYTSKISNVAKILKNGFAWIANRRNLMEILVPEHDFINREPQQYGMVSFTDIPPGEANSHSSSFGCFGIVVTDDWAKRSNAQKVIYIDDQGPITELLRAIFMFGYEDCKANIQFHDDAGWNMAFENAACAKALAGANLWANLLHLYEYMESSMFSGEREWRITNPVPHYGLAGKRTDNLIENASPPLGWGKHLNVVKLLPSDVFAFACPASKSESLIEALPDGYDGIKIIMTGG
ncbi:MAG: abortive infection system antitoxin AbiGi family protein [Candidatus Thiodiazotropha sp.]